MIKIAKEIQLSNGHTVLVDDEDYEWLNQWKWQYGSGGYAVRKEYLGYHYLGYKKKGKDITKSIPMHRLIMGVIDNPDVQIDHINGNPSDNRKENLRICTNAQNCRNRNKPNMETSSKYKGVSYYKATNSWSAHIKLNYKKTHIGYYTLEEAAAMAYNVMAKLYHGEFAKLNDIDFPDYEAYKISDVRGVSKFKGVGWNKQQQKWYAQFHITKHGPGQKVKHLGLFDSEIEAAKAWNAAVIKYRGENSKTKLNIIPDGPQSQAETQQAI